MCVCVRTAYVMSAAYVSVPYGLVERNNMLLVVVVSSDAMHAAIVHTWQEKLQGTQAVMNIALTRNNWDGEVAKKPAGGATGSKSKDKHEVLLGGAAFSKELAATSTATKSEPATGKLVQTTDKTSKEVSFLLR